MGSFRKTYLPRESFGTKAGWMEINLIHGKEPLTLLVFEDGRLKSTRRRRAKRKRRRRRGREGEEKKRASEKLFNYKHGLPSPFQLHNRA